MSIMSIICAQYCTFLPATRCQRIVLHLAGLDAALLLVEELTCLPEAEHGCAIVLRWVNRIVLREKAL